MPKQRTVRLVEIAELLGVTKQRAHQIAEEKGFPAPLAEAARGRVWSSTRCRRGRNAGRARSPGTDREQDGLVVTANTAVTAISR
jgi:hypothetical protein